MASTDKNKRDLLCLEHIREGRKLDSITRTMGTLSPEARGVWAANASVIRNQQLDRQVEIRRLEKAVNGDS